jgi:DDE superfamily endonuclease
VRRSLWQGHEVWGGDQRQCWENSSGAPVFVDQTAEYVDSSHRRRAAARLDQRQLHVVCDNYGTHSHPNVKAWLTRNPRITMHFTPTGASWMNMEQWFGIITRQAIRRGTFTSVPDLIGATRTFIDGVNERCQPFTWTKTAEQILAKANRQSLPARDVGAGAS